MKSFWWERQVIKSITNCIGEVFEKLKHIIGSWYIAGVFPVLVVDILKWFYIYTQLNLNYKILESHLAESMNSRIANKINRSTVLLMFWWQTVKATIATMHIIYNIKHQSSNCVSKCKHIWKMCLSLHLSKSVNSFSERMVSLQNNLLLCMYNMYVRNVCSCIH